MLHSKTKTELRQRFIDHLVLQQKAARTVQAYTAWIYDLAKFTHRPPDSLTPADVRTTRAASWLGRPTRRCTQPATLPAAIARSPPGPPPAAASGAAVTHAGAASSGTAEIVFM